jgi:hypothetical protein
MIGVELKWVEHDQVTEGKGRELLENSYLTIQPRFSTLTEDSRRQRRLDTIQK